MASGADCPRPNGLSTSKRIFSIWIIFLLPAQRLRRATPGTRPLELPSTIPALALVSGWAGFSMSRLWRSLRWLRLLWGTRWRCDGLNLRCLYFGRTWPPCKIRSRNRRNRGNHSNPEIRLNGPMRLPALFRNPDRKQHGRPLPKGIILSAFLQKISELLI